MNPLSLFSLLPLLALLGTTLGAPKPPTVKRPGLIHRRDQLAKRYTNQVDTSAHAPTTTAPKQNIWASLSFDEAASVKQFLHDQSFLNLTAVEDAGEWDNHILTVDFIAPNKTDALGYLDGSGELPPRMALASILFGATEEPYVQTFAVGPLPVSDETTAIPNIFGSSAPEAKIKVFDQTSSGPYIRSIALEMKDIINDLLDLDIQEEEDLSTKVYLWGIDPLWHETDSEGVKHTINWVQIWRNSDMITLPSGEEFMFDEGTLLPQGFYIGVDITGRDESKWSVLGFYYGGNYYASIDEFRSAYESPDFIKLPVNYPSPKYDTDKKGDALPYDTLPPPRQVQPGGQRFEVDDEEKYVKWMDFEFYITFTRDTGVRLYDIKFKGERIMFELGLQEAVAHYAGQDPVQSGIGYLDSYYGFGPYAFNLIPGYDIPFYAKCLGATYHEGEEAVTHDCGIAVYESDQGYLMQRHTTGSYVSTTKNIALTVRSVNTIGNYDYQFDYTFYMDGTIETLVRASGYIQSAYFANNTDYGYQINDALSGSMHDHILTFKADIDIAGTNNTMAKHTFVPVTEKYPWSNSTRNTMKLTRHDVETEADSKMNWAPNAAEQVLIVNKDAKNQYGEERGYKIMPHRGGGMRTTIPDSSNLKNSQEFAKYNYYVTKAKDEEVHATSPWNAYDVENPLIDFATYFNNESLIQEDLVVWYNLGMHHVPHTGDLPNTVFTTAQSSVMFTPHNFLLEDASRATAQMIRINYGSETATDVETFGQEAASGQINMEQIAWDPSTYYGDITTRKFPYEGAGRESTEDTELSGSSPTRRMLHG